MNNNTCYLNVSYAIVLEKNKSYKKEKRKQCPWPFKGLLHTDICIIG